MAHRKPHLSMQEFMDELCEIALEKLDPTRKSQCEAKRQSANRGHGLTKVKMSDAPSAPEVDTARSVKTGRQVKVARQYISVKIKREVWKKSEGRCANCRSEYALEIDHIKPLATRGDNNRENLRLLCRRCNQRAAIKQIGSEIYKYIE